MFNKFKETECINFLNPARYISLASFALIVISIISFFTNKLNLDLEFTGGVDIIAEFQKDVDLKEIREQLQQAQMSFIKTNNFGSKKNIVFKFRNQENIKSIEQGIVQLMQNIDSEYKIISTNKIGPSIGQNLIKQGFLAIVVAIIFVMLYISARFEWRFAIGSILALMHDIIISIGIFSILKINFDVNVLAGILTIIGYSLNDTIVVFDRIRENLINDAEEKETKHIINLSVTQTLRRTIITTLTTMLVVISLLILGGENIKGFAIAMMFGIITGSYSSIYIASYLAYAIGISKETVTPEQVEKEGADQPRII